jgi:phosphoribosyl 1,2-cyclic phosphate phosphodiesterase
MEIGPDIREQSAKFDLSTVNDYLVSHWHFDHLYGLHELGPWAESKQGMPMKIFCSEETSDWLGKNFGYIRKDIHVVRAYEPFNIGDIKITPLPVNHTQPNNSQLFKDSNTFGFLIEHSGKRVAYLSDNYGIPEKSAEYIKGCDLVIADGTFLFQEEWPESDLLKVIRDDPSHLHGAKIFGTIQKLNAKKTLFFSIAHLSELTHEQLQKKLPRRMKVSYDGMQLKL